MVSDLFVFQLRVVSMLISLKTIRFLRTLIHMFVAYKILALFKQAVFIKLAKNNLLKNS